MEKVTKEYTNLRAPGAYSSLSGFIKSSKNKNQVPEVVENALRQIPGYRLHVPVPRKFKRRRVYVSGIDDQWAIDLLDMRKWSKSNYNKNYILCVVDVFSKMAWMEALKDKTMESVVAALEKVIKRTKRVCENLQSDEGTEFLNQKMKKLTAKHNINHFVVYSPMKCCIAERFFRTIGQKISRYMTQNKTKRFINKLTNFEFLYNNSYHRSIKMKPIEVNKSNEMDVWHNLFGNEKIPKKIKLHFKIGDSVRKMRVKTIFEKGYSSYFEDDVYYIHEIKESNPPMYYLRTADGKAIKGGYYKQELQRAIV
jgi:hypothetical protein